MLTLHRRLLALRRAEPALHLGTWAAVDAPAGVIAYDRDADGTRVPGAAQPHARSRSACPWTGHGSCELSTGLDRGAGAPAEGAVELRGRRGPRPPRTGWAILAVTLDLFLRGLAVGFAVAFALGPIGLLVIRRTIDRGWAYGFLSGVGVASADAMYGAIAAFGLTAVTEVLVGIDRPLGVIGGAVLLVLAARSLRAALREHRGAAARAEGGRLDGPARGRGRPWSAHADEPGHDPVLRRAVREHRGGDRRAGGATSVVLGVFSGSVAWWALLTGLVAGLRARLTPRVVRWLNIASAVVIGGFGVIAIALGVAG